MIQILITLTIILSLVGGGYAIVLLSQLRKKHSNEFLNSFFYYQILVVIFGLYGILGSLLLREILPKFEINKPILEAVVHFLPFLGIPFIVAAWYLKLKMAGELVNKKLPQYVAIIYFLVCTLAFLGYGFFIKEMPEKVNLDYPAIQQKVQVAFYLIEVAIISYFVFILLVSSARLKIKSHKVFIQRFALITAGVTILSALSLQFAYIHTIIGLYFILLFFIGDLPLVFLSKVYLAKEAEAKTESEPEDNLFKQYGISKREKEIIEEICKGKANKEIAEALFITLQTVKDHTHNIYRKVDVKNRVQLAQLFSKGN